MARQGAGRDGFRDRVRQGGTGRRAADGDGDSGGGGGEADESDTPRRGDSAQSSHNVQGYWNVF
jgi:hypothetical protein